MPGNQVNDLIQDRYGRIWIGTMNGAAVFDGVSFNIFEPGEPIRDFAVKSLFEDSKGNIWLGMIDGGLALFNGTKWAYFNDSTGFVAKQINAITEDQRGHIWIATSDGLYRYDGKKFHNYNEIRGLLSNNVFSVMCDSKGVIWAATYKGVSRLALPDIENFTVANGLGSDITYHLSEAPNGDIWIGTYLGISIFNGNYFAPYNEYPSINTERIENILSDESGTVYLASYGSGVGVIKDDSLSYITVNEGLPSNIIRAIIKDREGNLWFGTWSGLCKFKSELFTTYSVNDGLNNKNLLSVAGDKEGRVWLGTLTGGINYFENGKLFSLGLEEGLKSSTIWSIYPDDDNYHWFGTTNGPVRLNLDDMSFSNPIPLLEKKIIYSITKRSSGDMAFGTDNGVYIFDKDFEQLELVDSTSGLDNHEVRVLYEDISGLLWIGTSSNIYYYNNGEATDLNKRFNIQRAPVTSIIQDSRKNILYSTYGAGVVIYNPEVEDSLKVRILDVNHGLYSDKVLFNYIDENNSLWVGTSSGLDCINWSRFIEEKKLILNHFDKSNGYSGLETNAACSDLEGNIWFATVNGAIRYNSSTPFNQNILPILRISGLQLFNDNVDWKKEKIKFDERTGLPIDLILAYNNNNLSFTFQGIYITQPSAIRFQFILEGFEEAWSPVSTQTFANFSNLPAGDYNFKVRATVNGRDWSIPVTYSFSIKPPYWKTPFFYFLYLATITGSIFLFFKLRTRTLQRNQDILRQKVEQRTQELNEKNLELEKLSIVASETDNAVLIFDNSKNIEWANSGYVKLTGYTVEEIITGFGSGISDFIFNDDADSITDECISTKSSRVFESQIPCKDGKLIWVSCTLTPIFSETERLKKIVLINTDITFRKEMEEQIRKSLDEKGLLLKEIHHRVKNNLQIIISLFNLQTHYIEDDKSLETLKEGQDRIKSMALIHERFYQSDGLSKIDFDDYIRRLTENLYLSFNISSERIRLVLDTDKISLDIDSAVPCGLIINELISNALKHAFKGRENGELKVSFKTFGDQMIRLVVSDNGVGMQPGFDMESSDSLGMQLMQALTSQLDGTLTIHQGNGTVFILEFKNVYHSQPKAEA